MFRFSPYLLFLFLSLPLLWNTGCKNEPAAQEEVPWTRTSNEVVVRLPAEPRGLNPVVTGTDQYSTQVYRGNIMLYLLGLDPKTQKFAPMLAKSQPEIKEISEGPLAGGASYTFEILEEATWDNGTPVTAEDYVFSIKAVLNPKVPAQRLRPYLEQIKDIQLYPDNPKKLTVLTDEPYILALEAMVGVVPVMPVYHYDPDGIMANFTVAQLAQADKLEVVKEDPRLQTFADQFAQEQYSRDPGQVVGCGPYRLEEWESGQRLVLAKKENWWGNELAEQYPLLQAEVDKITFRPIRDQASAAALLRSEEVDVAITLDAKDFTDLRDQPEVAAKYNFFTPANMAFYFLYLNTKDPMLEDPKVRRAIAHLVDVPEIIETVFYGLGERIIGPVHPSKDYYADALPPIDFDVEKAKLLLAEAGWTDSNNNGTIDKVVNGERTEMELTFLTTNNTANESISLYLKEAAQKAGINLEIVAKEAKAQIADLRAREYQIASGALGAQPVLDDFYQIWHTSSDRPDGYNRTGFGNATSDQLIEDIRRTLDKQQRDEMYLALQKMIYEDQPMVFLMAPQNRIVIHKRFETEASVVSPGYFPGMFRLKGSNQ
jgi:peptide/nickel transport system substrate-binding protein